MTKLEHTSDVALYGLFVLTFILFVMIGLVGILHTYRYWDMESNYSQVPSIVIGLLGAIIIYNVYRYYCEYRFKKALKKIREDQRNRQQAGLR